MFGKDFEYQNLKFVAIFVLILLFGIFLGKNFTRVPVWLFGWTQEVPLILIALVCFAVGGICGWAFSWFMRRRSHDETL